MKHTLTAMLVLVLAVLFAVVLTWVLWPFWNWLESNYGIESVGHSGPADWCYWATLGATVCLIFMAWGALRRK